MCRKPLRSSWLVFLALIFILGLANCYSTGVFDPEDEDYYVEDLDSIDYPQKKRSQESPEDRRWMGIGKREPAFTPYISVGALSNMQQFFENLKENLDSLENLPMEERAALNRKHDQTAAPRLQSGPRRVENEQETRIFRPPATAAYLHAIRNQRPSHKIRNFVANAEPASLRGTNHYDPSFMWSGLGKRR